MTAILVRVWGESYYDVESINVFVDDWDSGVFTLPADHPGAIALFLSPRRLLTVYSTDELEWVVRSFNYYSAQARYRFYCVPRITAVRAGIASDDYLVELWLAAEQRWRYRDEWPVGEVAI